MNSLRAIAIGLALCLAAIAAIATAVFTLSRRIDGESMEPNLNDGDRVFLEAVETPERFSVVIGQFNATGAMFVKRVIGLPGDSVEIVKWGPDAGTVRVQPGSTGPWFEVRNPAWPDRWSVVASNCCNPQGKTGSRPRPQQVPEGKLFVLGDNIGASEDSRKFGWMPIELVNGAVTFRVLPSPSFSDLTDDVTLVPAE